MGEREPARERTLARLRESVARLERLRRDGIVNGNHALVVFTDDLIIRYEELAFRIEHGYACPTDRANSMNGHGANGHAALPSQQM